jgi:methionyl-tRNA formyltransferase
MVPCEVKQKALELGLTVFDPEKLDSQCLEKIAAIKPDLLVVVAFGTIFKKDFLDLFPFGGINLHPSALPKYRGPSPLNAALLGGDPEIGITVQRLALKMDSGEILVQKTYPLDPRANAADLTSWAGETGADLVAEAVRGLRAGTLSGIPQDDRAATFCRIIKKEDGLIHWDHCAVQIDRMIRAYQPWPRAYTVWKGQILFIDEAFPLPSPAGTQTGGLVSGIDKASGILVQTKDGLLAIKRLQLASKKPVDFQSFMNGNKDIIGSVLGG